MKSYLRRMLSYASLSTFGLKMFIPLLRFEFEKCLMNVASTLSISLFTCNFPNWIIRFFNVLFFFQEHLRKLLYMFCIITWNDYSWTILVPMYWPHQSCQGKSCLPFSSKLLMHFLKFLQQLGINKNFSKNNYSDC